MNLRSRREKLIQSPVDADVLELLLTQSGYDVRETHFLVDGFRNGFSLGYEGPENVTLNAPNLKLDRPGDEDFFVEQGHEGGWA